MNLLVTGATGFLGSHLCRRLVGEGHQVTVFRRPDSDTRLIAALDVRQVYGDIADPEAVARAVVGQQAVIHAAANLSYWGRHRIAQHRTNVEGTHHVVDACRREAVGRLLFISSVAAIGIPEDPLHPADESFRFNLEGTCLNYHLSKWRAEQEVFGVEDLDAVAVNPGTLFGPIGKRYRGIEMIEKVRHNRVVPYFLGGINAVHVLDVVDGIVRALERGTRGRRYILGGENITFRRIAEAATEAFGLERFFVPVPRPLTATAASLLEPLAALRGKRPWMTHERHYCAGRFHYYNSARAIRRTRVPPAPLQRDAPGSRVALLDLNSRPSRDR